MQSKCAIKQRVPVMAGPRCVEKAGPERVRWLLRAKNARAIWQRKSRSIVEIQLEAFGDDSALQSKWANPQALSTKYETPENPRNVWMLKRLRAAH